MQFSIIIPVYNRPNEIQELLQSLSLSNFQKPFEIVIIEDGSTVCCEDIVQKFQDKLLISYFYKSNSGPGDSRNFGMKKAKGDYFLIFDSDCIIPENYLTLVDQELTNSFVDFFGGADKALDSFSKIQKAINFAMTSFLTTGGIRGGSENISAFQPRSFNMGISKFAFEKSKGFGTIHPGEDPDLTIRLWQLGFKSRLFKSAFVYHKRRIDWEKFKTQVSKFGKARPILNLRYSKYQKIVFWFPTFFSIGFLLSIAFLLLLIDWPLKVYFGYFVLLFLAASIQNKSLEIGFYALKATFIQFFYYGFSFLYSFLKISIAKIKPEIAFPELFFVKKTPIIVGLTGGIGSGKTTIANHIRSLGFPVYISDDEAKKVLEKPAIIAKIVNLFGEQILDKVQKIDKNILSSIVFSNSEKLKSLNQIVHPEVKLNFENWVDSNKKSKIIFKEAAILFESGSYKDCDFVISISAPQALRIQRVVKRDNCDEARVLSRIKNQLSDDDRNSKSDFVVQNDINSDFKSQVDAIITTILNS